MSKYNFKLRRPFFVGSELRTTTVFFTNRAVESNRNLSSFKCTIWTGAWFKTRWIPSQNQFSLLGYMHMQSPRLWWNV